MLTTHGKSLTVHHLSPTDHAVPKDSRPKTLGGRFQAEPVKQRGPYAMSEFRKLW